MKKNKSVQLPTLSPCPFDGGKARFADSVPNKWFYVECSNGHCKSCGRFYPTAERAAKAWNRRMAPTTAEIVNSMMIVSDFGDCLMELLECLALAEPGANASMKRRIQQTIRRIKKKIHRRQQLTARIFKKRFGKAPR